MFCYFLIHLIVYILDYLLSNLLNSSFLLTIVGNKDDSPDLKVVEKGDAQRFAEQMGVQLYETSAKENQNIEEVLETITSFIV